MKNKLWLIFLLAAFSIKVYTQAPYYHHPVIDSVLVVIKDIILKDFKVDGVILSPQPHWHSAIGEAFVLEVFLDEKKCFPLTGWGTSAENYGSKKKKPYFKRKIFYSGLRSGVFPYVLCDHLKYKFLILSRIDDSFDALAIYGEYRFRAGENTMEVLDKRVEYLKEEESVLEIYNSNL